jgi:metal-responsive CopG/Arc/MetJ family transcriptional regulator
VHHRAIKARISINENLAREADRLAEELAVSRSQLYVMALAEFIERRESCKLRRQLDEVYADGLDEEEQHLLPRARDYRHQRLEPHE